MQFDGPGVAGLSMDDRMTIANMAIEAGGKNGIFECDGQTRAAVDYRCKLNGTKSVYEPVERDRDEKFVYELVVELSQLEPTVACHPDPGQRKPAKELGNIKLDRAYIGSCTGGKTSDFLEFARVLRGKRVTIDTFGVPATPEIVRDLQTAKWGDQTVWQILLDAGVQMTENAGCAACLGRAGGHLRPDEFTDEMHQRHEPEFSRPDGAQGIPGFSRVTGDGGRERDYRPDHRPAGVFELSDRRGALAPARENGS